MKADSISSNSEWKVDKKGLKIMIQVDFEGVAGIVNFDEIYPGHSHFERNCTMLTQEVNAAIEGAVAAGATTIVVRDGHAGNINVDPLLLDRRAMLTRGRVPGTPHTMVLGIDSTFDALLFIGAHARAGEQMGTLSHTMSLKVAELKINGRPISEPAFNSLYASQFNVPVVFIAGDNTTCKEAKRDFGEIETVVTKYAFGRTCAMSKSPYLVREEIKAAVERALRNLEKGSMFRLEAPYKMEVKIYGENPEEIISVKYESEVLEDVMKKFWENL
jgi:D-amino peptidase